MNRKIFKFSTSIFAVRCCNSVCIRGDPVLLCAELIS